MVGAEEFDQIEWEILSKRFSKILLHLGYTGPSRSGAKVKTSSSRVQGNLTAVCWAGTLRQTEYGVVRSSSYTSV
jgi:hypothetical protein